MTPGTPDDSAAIVPLDEAVTIEAVTCPVGGMPALARVLRSLLGPARPSAERVVVVTAPAIAVAVRHALSEAGLTDSTVVECPSPATRTRCLAAGLEHLDPRPDSAVLVHDHRSPLATGAVTDRVVSGLGAGHQVVVPALTVTDTVKETDDAGAVRQTVDRQSLRTVQFPRGYRAATLRTLVESPGDDEFTAALAASIPLELVTGDADAITAYLPDDASLLDAILASRDS